ncbi:hypothetical protein OK142_01230 [Agrobacterium sp. BT-220-3]|nr:hypothetical protein [Agrobacterium sp. BT-220-3]
MNDALKALIAAACVCIIAATSWYLYKERQSYVAEQNRRQSLSDIATTRDIDRLRELAIKKQKELAAVRITPQRCADIANRTIPDKAGEPPKTYEFVEELKLCDDFKRLGAYERHQLDLIGVF